MKDDGEGFLSRWSRRKVQGDGQQAALEQGAAAVEAGQVQPGAVVEEEPFDVSVLPPIDSLTKDSDFTGFLKKGVPPGLKKAALQKMWMSDPAIRDYIGLSEMSWDFNSPEAFHGYGALSPFANVAEMVRDIAEGPLARALSPAESAGDERAAGLPQGPSDAVGEPVEAQGATESGSAVLASDHAANEAAFMQAPQPSDRPYADELIQNGTKAPDRMPKRRHGSAIPH